MRQLLAPAILAICLSGCGSSDPFEVPRTQSPDHPSAAAQSANPTLQELRETAKSATIACDGACSPSVGFITVASPDGVHACVGTLVAPDRVLTSSRCLPQDIERPGASCEGRVWVTFPGLPHSYPRVQSECAQIEHASGHTAGVSADYAFLRLTQPVSRAIAPLSSDGLDGPGKVRVFKIGSAPGNLNGNLTSAECAVLPGRSFEASADPRRGPSLLLTGCDLNPSISGAPLIDSFGRVAGVVSTGANLDAYADLAIDGPFQPIYSGTNLACVMIPGERSAASSFCQDPASLTRERDATLNDEGARRRLERWTKTRVASALPLQWQLVTSPGKSRTDVERSPVPLCVDSKRLDLSKGKAQFSFLLPSWNDRLGLDTSGVWKQELGESEPAPAFLMITWPESGAFFRFRTTLVGRGPGGGEQTLFQGELVGCAH